MKRLTLIALTFLTVSTPCAMKVARTVWVQGKVRKDSTYTH